LDVTTGKLNLVDFGSGAFRKNEPYTEFDGNTYLIKVNINMTR
jgi:hypothetical protein